MLSLFEVILVNVTVFLLKIWKLDFVYFNKMTAGGIKEKWLN
jgi:hypothetical protein